MEVKKIYRMRKGGKKEYDREEENKEEMMRKVLKGRGKIEIGSLKGIGEMREEKIKEKKMEKEKSKMLRVKVDEEYGDEKRNKVDEMMGKKKEERLRFIKEREELVEEMDIW